MKVNALLASLNCGEVSKIALTRVDVAKLRLAAACQVNWLPYVVGPMSLRPGLFYVGGVLNNNPTRILPFVFSKLDTALLELTANEMRIWINEVLLTRPAVTTTINDPFFNGGSWTTSNTTSGASATISGGLCTLSCPPTGGLAQIQQVVTCNNPGVEHGIRLVITNGPVVIRAGSSAGTSDVLAQATLDTGTYSLSIAPSGNFTIQIESTDAWNKTLTQCSIESAGAVTVPSPWAGADLPNIRIDQSLDEIFVACLGQQQRIIERSGVRPGARGWGISLYRGSVGPFQPAPGIKANFTPGNYYGNTTLTSDRPWFQPGHVGCLFRLFSNGQFDQAILGAQNAYTPAVRVTGVGTASRNYTWTPADGTSTWIASGAVLTFQRSFDSGVAGFVDISTVTANTAISSSTGSSGGSPDLDNAIVWERVGFEAGNYNGGSAVLVSNYAGGGGFGICRVTGFVSPTQVNIEVLSPFTTLQATTDWVEGDWSGVVGFPTSVTFHEGRLGWYRSDQGWLSASDDFTNYADINLDGTSTGDAGAINFVLGQGPGDTISWGLSLTRLLLGREQSITSVRSSNFDQPLTPTAFVARPCSDQGAQRLPAVKIGKRGIFVQQSGRRVYELAFANQEMDYDDRDLTRLNLDIGAVGFNDIDIQTQPDHMVWLPRGDGMAACLLYDVKDEVEAWWRMMTLGFIENVCVLPQNGIEDLVYFVVRRVINGQTVRFIERLAPRANCVGGAINQQLDAHVVYQGSPVTSITLAHLPNTLVSVWADGAFIGTGTTNGAGVLSPLPDGAIHSNIVAGLAGVVISNAGVINPVVATSGAGSSIVVE